MRTHIRAALAVLPLALALTGCGGSDGNREVASANGGGSDGPTSSAPKLSHDEAVLKYAQCLRDHGLAIEDPKPGEGIQIQNNGPADKAKNDQAVRACAQAMPPEQNPGNGESERATMLKVAKCMRDNGVENFPDPKPGEGIGIDEKIGGDPDFDAAWKKCNQEAGVPDTHGDTAGSNG